MQRAQVLAQCEKIGHDKNRRGQHQGRVNAGRDEQRHDQEIQRTDHQVQPRAEHIVDFAHIVRRARHGIADRLQVMESHALAQQADIQLVAHFPFHGLRQKLRAKVAAKLQHPPQHLRARHPQRQPGKLFNLRRAGQDSVESLPDQERGDRRQGGISQRSANVDQPQYPVADGMREDPAHRSAAVALEAVFRVNSVWKPAFVEEAAIPLLSYPACCAHFSEIRPRSDSTFRISTSITSPTCIGHPWRNLAAVQQPILLDANIDKRAKVDHVAHSAFQAHPRGQVFHL